MVAGSFSSVIQRISRRFARQKWAAQLNSQPSFQHVTSRRSVFIIDPKAKIRLMMTYPMSVGRNFDEILRVIDALQTCDANKIATPADWRPGDEVIIPPSVSDAAAADLFPQGWTTHRPYLRTVKL